MRYGVIGNATVCVVAGRGRGAMATTCPTGSEGLRAVRVCLGLLRPDLTTVVADRVLEVATCP